MKQVFQFLKERVFGVKNSTICYSLIVQCRGHDSRFATSRLSARYVYGISAKANTVKKANNISVGL